MSNMTTKRCELGVGVLNNILYAISYYFVLD